MEKNLLTIDNLKNVGLVGLLAIILYLSFSGTWVWGTQLKEEQARTASALSDRDRWMKLALEGTRLAEVASVKTGVPSAPMDIPSLNPDKPMTPEKIAKRLDRVSEAIEPGIERTPATSMVK